MKKKLFAGLAALALAGGITLGGVTVANAEDTTPEITKLCGQTGCEITVDGSSTVKEGETVTVNVKGNADATVELGLFTNDGENVAMLGSKVSVTLDANGEGAAQVTVPELVDHVGGKQFVVATSDLAQAVEAKKGAPYAELTVHSRNAALVADATGNGSSSNPFVLKLGYGLQGDKFKAQAHVNGKWVDFQSADGKNAIGEDGTVSLKVISPKVAEGKYEVRFFNVSKNVGGPTQGTLYIGVTPDEDGGDKGPDKGGDKGPDKGGDKNPDKGDKDKPSLPSTGV